MSYPTMSKQKQKQPQTAPTRKDGMPYRPLTIPERDFLFALYDKHGGNVLAMTRDQDCIFKSDRQMRFYSHFYGFQPKLAEIRRRRAEEVVSALGDAKVEAIQRAAELLQPKQFPVKARINGEIVVLRDADDLPIYETIYPTDREIKTAYEIIKTELGEPTNIQKSEVSNPHAEEVTKALDLIERLSHGEPRTNTNPISSEREAPGSTTEVPAIVRDDIPQEDPED